MNRYTQVYINSYVNKDLEQTKTAGIKVPKIDFGKAIRNGIKSFGISTAKSPVVQGLVAKTVVPDVAKAVGVDPEVADELGTGVMAGFMSRGRLPYTKGPMIKSPLLNVAAGVGAGLFANSSDIKNRKADEANANANKSNNQVKLYTPNVSVAPTDEKLNLSPYDPPEPSKLYDPDGKPVPNTPFTLSPYSED